MVCCLVPVSRVWTELASFGAMYALVVSTRTVTASAPASGWSPSADLDLPSAWLDEPALYPGADESVRSPALLLLLSLPWAPLGLDFAVVGAVLSLSAAMLRFFDVMGVGAVLST